MAITRSFDTAIPSISGGKVVRWELGMTYTNGTSGSASFYQSEFSTIINSSTFGLSSDFTPKAEGSWTKAQLLSLISPITGHWDQIFASQINSVITNPTVAPIPDNNYVIPS
jgi:hypothetical protein